MEDRETMQQLADKMRSGCYDLAGLPWGSDWSKAIIGRLTGKTKSIPKKMLEEGLHADQEDILAAEVNHNWEGVSDLLAKSFDFASTPEGEEFWHTVMTVLLLYEKKLQDQED